MNCRDLSEFLQDYFSGELPQPVADEFAGHLHGCENCTVFVEQYRLTITAGQTVRSGDEQCEVPEDLINAIVASLKATR